MYFSVDHPSKQPPAILLKPGHLGDHRTSPKGEAKVLSLVGLVKEVAAMAKHMDPACLAMSGLQYGPASSWAAQH